MNFFYRPEEIKPTDAHVNPVATFDARELVKNGTQARIVLDGQLYILRITRAGKLILTK